jgi:hypothetical protein
LFGRLGCGASRCPISRAISSLKAGPPSTVNAEGGIHGARTPGGEVAARGSSDRRCRTLGQRLWFDYGWVLSDVHDRKAVRRFVHRPQPDLPPRPRVRLCRLRVGKVYEMLVGV